ncbi:hypothetical protein [Allomuricauda sp. ARW1Y1]|jgi:hypothetical protein|uniref:hypothetical protein n=1 Tax=Allomuricauda sp. ARW1Y1 TaxID=2663843 RepID=UPI0015CDF400|nr:hypothetical protein [Muricauda sp. ARW1Y1]NYJ28096.1 hypothetical protein [Muricauda sp. ARW1Y1]
MYEWYLPITILPGLGMLILSTTSQMMTLSAEISSLLQEKCSPFQHNISDQKIKQLGRLTRASVLLYLAAGLYVLSGILGAVKQTISHYSLSSLSLYVGTLLVLLALGLLIWYAFRAVGIRMQQHEHNHNL